MSAIDYRDGVLTVEQLPLTRVAAEFGTPCYVYSSAALTEAFSSYQQAFAALNPLICYAIKANSNLSLLRHFARLGAGFDIVSGGELERVLAIGGDPKKIVFSGVGKTEAEMRRALEAGIFCFNVESPTELDRLNAVAASLNVRAPISLRVNPNVDAKTHPYISTGLKDNKFGIRWEEALPCYRHAASLSHLDVVGIDCHIGSQLTELSPLLDALDRLLALVDQLAAEGIVLHHVDIGGGVGIRYREETPPDLHAYAQAVASRLAGRSLQLLMEPGRSLVGNAGVLLTEVEFIKQGDGKTFVIVDAAMNDLARPALYDAWHDIQPVTPRHEQTPQLADVVGPVCESGDFLGKNRELAVQAGDLLAVMSAGAYGFTMSSNYNTRPRAAEVLVHGEEMRLIRQRETFAQLIENEIDLVN